MCSLLKPDIAFGATRRRHEYIYRGERGLRARLARNHPLLPATEPDCRLDRHAPGFLAAIRSGAVELFSSRRGSRAAELSDVLFSGQLATDRAVHGDLLIHFDYRGPPRGFLAGRAGRADSTLGHDSGQSP